MRFRSRERREAGAGEAPLRAMANRVLAEELIPLLGEYGLAAVQDGTLASHFDFLRLLHHHIHYRSNGFQGVRSIVCKIDRNKKARFEL